MASYIWIRTILIVRKETCCRHTCYSFRLAGRNHPTDRIAHTTAFVTPVVGHWLEREIAQCVHHVGSIRRPTSELCPAPCYEISSRGYLVMKANYLENCFICTRGAMYNIYLSDDYNLPKNLILKRITINNTNSHRKRSTISCH